VKLRSRRRRKGEPLSELTEDVERLSRLVYREVPSSLQDEPAKEQFVDALTDDDLLIRLMQARPASLMQARPASLMQARPASLMQARPASLMQARPASLHEALRLAIELESYNMAVRQRLSIRAVTVTEDTTSHEKAPEYEQLKETLLVVAEGMQKLLLEKLAAPFKDDQLNLRNAT
ncbi:hypothetical protein LSAT2_032846, partial [Lamellibrachia satsuma]